MTEKIFRGDLAHVLSELGASEETMAVAMGLLRCGLVTVNDVFVGWTHGSKPKTGMPGLDIVWLGKFGYPKNQSGVSGTPDPKRLSGGKTPGPPEPSENASERR